MFYVGLFIVVVLIVIFYFYRSKKGSKHSPEEETEDFATEAFENDDSGHTQHVNEPDIPQHEIDEIVKGAVPYDDGGTSVTRELTSTKPKSDEEARNGDEKIDPNDMAALYLNRNQDEVVSQSM